MYGGFALLAYYLLKYEKSTNAGMSWMKLDQFFKTLVIIPENWLEFPALGCSPKSFRNMVML